MDFMLLQFFVNWWIRIVRCSFLSGFLISTIIESNQIKLYIYDFKNEFKEKAIRQLYWKQSKLSKCFKISDGAFIRHDINEILKIRKYEQETEEGDWRDE